MARVLLILACVCVILARIGGTHFHLCLDGNEPLSSVHLLDDGDADLHFGANVPHTDIDVSAVGNLLIKHDSVVGDLLPVLLGALLVLGLLQRPATRLPRAQVTFLTPSSVFELRPPPRGPPV